MNFEQWLGALLNKHEAEVHRLLDDPAALRFLIAWSLFESKCFDGFVKIDRIDVFAARIVAEGFDSNSVDEELVHFHERYQDDERYRQLMHGQLSKRMDALRRHPLESFRQQDRVFFVATVAYRFRNNMFHGNKGVQSWLHYSKQIRHCTGAIGRFVSHAELRRPSLPERQVA
jgi:hypothetical protein